ncbi:MAG: zinc ribbon domain-containing protein [Clostridia bacterium]|nr:zinc ribbon domain-containing protein [Clostridia bacterium]
MYCRNCGKELDDSATFCPHCGVPTDNYIPPETNFSTATNVCAIVGFILSFFVVIAGLVISIIGYKKAPEYNGNGKGLAIAGIIISAAEIAVVFFSVVFWIIILAAGGAPAVS